MKLDTEAQKLAYLAVTKHFPESNARRGIASVSFLPRSPRLMDRVDALRIWPRVT